MKPPIAEPFGAPNSDDSTKRCFGFDLWQGFAASLSITAPVIMVCWLVLFPVRGYGKFVFMLVTSFAMFAFVLLSVALMKVWVSKSSIKAPDFWGFAREIEWSQIKSVKSRWIFWSYVVISTHQKRNALWIPLFFRNSQDFARAVESWAPADNPLRLFLQKRGF